MVHYISRLKWQRRIKRRQRLPPQKVCMSSMWCHLDSAMQLLHSSVWWIWSWLVCSSHTAWCTWTTLSSWEAALMTICRICSWYLRVQKAGLKLQPKKCAFLQTSVAYLGHIVSREGVSTDLPRSRKWLHGQCLQTERRSRASWALLAISDDSSRILLR